jgi:hypothetical protein
LAFHVLRQLASEPCGEKDIAILVSFALVNSQLAGLQIHVCQAELDKFGIPEAGKEEQFEHHQVRELAPMPDRFVEGD